MDKRKKVQVWLSPMEFKVLSDYCERNGVSFYSVLKEGMNRIILGDGVSQEPSPNTERKIQGKDCTSSSSSDSPTLSQQTSPQLQKIVQRLDWQEKQIDKIAGNEQLWHEVSELKAGLAELKVQVSGLENKMDKKFEDTMAEVLKKLGIPEERV